jgi:hypothetical protein
MLIYYKINFCYFLYKRAADAWIAPAVFVAYNNMVCET